MKWQKLAEREGDFLKNYLLYENFQDNFPRVFNRHHSNFLTTRKGNTFTHYMDEEDAKNEGEKKNCPVNDLVARGFGKYRPCQEEYPHEKG